jgi:hypothetical protein
MERTDWQLAETFREAMKMRAAMKAQGASEQSCTEAMARSLKAAWPWRPESEWPYFHRLPRCIHCDGYGLVIRTVINRLGCRVDEGTPCTCREGARYLEKPKAEQDFTQAGKVSKPMTRMGRWNG